MLRRWTSGGNKLELRPPLILNVELVGCAELVVKDLEINTMAALCEVGHDLICGSKAVAVVAGLEWLNQDYIGVHMIGAEICPVTVVGPSSR